MIGSEKSEWFLNHNTLYYRIKYNGYMGTFLGASF